MKLAFIYSFEQSSWKSCQAITKNLMMTYKASYPGSSQKSFDLHEHTTSFDMLNTANAIVNLNPNYIVIVDHKPHPHKMLDIIYKVYQDRKIKKLPPLIIHIFGDFTLYSKEWGAIEPVLKKFSVKFICASDAQKDLVGKFLKNKKTGLYKCPFPVDTKDFQYDQNLRSTYRKKLGHTEKQTLFIYTGRLSLQKKVLELIIDFAAFIKLSNADAYLYLAGEFDDLGNPFKGIYGKEGLFFQNYSALIQSLDENTRKRVSYIGNLSTEELKAFYSTGDAFVSLSFHNDEDYGMSPAEAICTGLPSILTAWAGYKSFKLPKNECQLITTSINENKLVYDKAMLFKAFTSTHRNIQSLRDNRLILQKVNGDTFSVLSNKSVIKKILDDKVGNFLGFTPLLKQLAEAFKKHPPFISTKVTYHYSDLYKKIYDSYISK